MQETSLINSLWTSDAIWSHKPGHIRSGNGLVPDGTKPLPEQCYDIISGDMWLSYENKFPGGPQDNKM